MHGVDVTKYSDSPIQHEMQEITENDEENSSKSETSEGVKQFVDTENVINLLITTFPINCYSTRFASVH